MPTEPFTSFGRLRSVLAAGAVTLSNASVLANRLAFERYTPDCDYELLGYLR